MFSKSQFVLNIPRVLLGWKKKMIDHGTKKKKCSNKLKKEIERRELPIQEATFMCLDQGSLDWSYLLLSTSYGVLFKIGNYGLQQITSIYQIVPSTLGGNISLFLIFIDKKHITKTRNLRASRIKL